MTRRWIVAGVAVILGLAGTGITPAFAEHLSDEGELQTRWVRHGFNEGWQLAVTDVDGDGDDEIIYGGRKIALLDEESIVTGLPVYTVKWNHDPPNQLDGGDNTWTTGLEIDPKTGDLFAATSDTDAYRIDPGTGEKAWHNPRLGSWFSDGVALFDAPGDDVTDVFTGGGEVAVSGVDGSVLWTAPIPRSSSFAVTAELDGDEGRELLIATNPSGVAINQKTVFAVDGDGELLWDFSPNSVVESLAAADVDGDGLDEAIVGTGTGFVHAIGAGGSLRWTAVPGLGAIESVAVGNIDIDERPEIMVGYRTPTHDEPGFQVVAYDNTGIELWRHVIGQPIETLEVVQLDDDLRPELIVGAGSTLNLSPVGSAVALETGIDAVVREKWRVPTFQQVKSAATIVMGGRRLALIGSADAILRAVDASTGQEVWTYAAGGYTFATAAGDVDGDGADEIAKSGTDGVLVLSDSNGHQRWAHRTDIGNNGIVRGMSMGDADGDGNAEVAVGGTRFAADDAGVVELYDGDGTQLWSTRMFGASEDVAIADIDGDGIGEVLAGEAAGLDGECSVNAFDSRTGEQLWRTPISSCLVPIIDAGDVDGDGTLEVAYGDRTLFGQPHLALLEGDGSIVWNKGISDQVFWIEALDDGVLHGGFTFGQVGSATRRDADGAVLWNTVLPGDDGFGSASRFGTLVTRADGGFDVAASADDGAVYLLSGDDGSIRWGTRLEPRELEHKDRHPAGPIVFVPAQGEVSERLIVGQYRTGRRRAQSFALALSGAVVGSIPMEGEAQAAALVRFGDGLWGAAIGAGLGVYALDACIGCTTGDIEPTSMTLELSKDRGDVVATATLIDSANAPISNKPIHFYVNGTLIITVTTEVDGRATAAFHRSEAKQGDVIKAEFAGDDIHELSSAEQTVSGRLI